MFNKILSEINYLSIKDIKYNNKYNYKLNNEEINRFTKYKEDIGIKLNLKTFDNNYIYYVNHSSLISNLREFLNFNLNYKRKNNSTLNEDNFTDIIISRILSEIEGTLQIENIPTTRKRIQEVIDKKIIKNENDIIIRNMDYGIKYILNKPKFNKENLHKLYSIITDDCLSEENKLNDYYRYDKVFIDGYEGCNVELIDECMNSLFEFVQTNLNNKSNLQYLLPHIAHYYVLYIHPYFDYNGRCSRLVSFWISLLTKELDQPLFISEAINNNKNLYYNSLTNTRDNLNDLTYFFNYIFNISNNFCLLYENIDYIETTLFDREITLSILEKNYLKRILSCISTKYFNQKSFLELTNLEMTKQGAFKILNKFEEYKILNSIINNKNQKMFYLNNEMIKYIMKKENI